MKNISLIEAEEKAKTFVYKLTCCEGLRNAVLIAKLMTKRLKKDLDKQKTSK